MAAASGEKDGFPLGPQLFFCLFAGGGTTDLVQGTPLTLITPFPLHQVSSSFHRPAAQDLVQRTPLILIIPFPLHQVSSSFRRPAAQDLVQRTPLTLTIPFPLHQVPPTFPYCGPPARGFQLPGVPENPADICMFTQRICSILCTRLIFYCIPQILEYNIVYQNN